MSFSKGRTLVVALLLFLAFGGCREIRVPPVSSTPTGVEHVGKFVWLDLVSEDVEASKQFYGDLFGWTFESVGEGDAYTLIRHGGKAMGGIIYSDRLTDVSESRWVSYLSVADVDASANLVRERGGRVHVAPTDVPDRGRLAVVADPHGAIVALLRASTGDPEDRELALNQWMWIELWTTDTDEGFEFYRELVGYDREAWGEVGGSEYWLMRSGESYRAGMVRLPTRDVTPNWLPYVLVDDPAAAASKAESMGGRILISSEAIAEHGAAILLDPSGAAFGVHRQPTRSASSASPRVAGQE